jgi:hypothetical protein
MTFAPGLRFALESVGPGVANTACPDTLSAADPACSIVDGSPFIVRGGPGGSTVSLAAFGTLYGNDVAIGSWGGTFSVSFASETPADLQARFANTGSITSGHTGSFVVNISEIPEPGTISMMAIGGGLIASALDLGSLLEFIVAILVAAVVIAVTSGTDRSRRLT